MLGAAASAPAAAADDGKAEEDEKKKKEEEEEVDADMGGLFGDEDYWVSSKFKESRQGKGPLYLTSVVFR